MPLLGYEKGGQRRSRLAAPKPLIRFQTREGQIVSDGAVRPEVVAVVVDRFAGACESNAHAIVLKDIDLGGGEDYSWAGLSIGPDEFVTLTLIGESRNPSKDFFVGLAEESAAASYLNNVEYDELIGSEWAQVTPFPTDRRTISFLNHFLFITILQEFFNIISPGFRFGYKNSFSPGMLHPLIFPGRDRLVMEKL